MFTSHEFLNEASTLIRKVSQLLTSKFILYYMYLNSVNFVMFIICMVFCCLLYADKDELGKLDTVVDLDIILISS